MYIVLCVWLLLSTSTLILGGYDPSVCKPTTGPSQGKSIPEVPQQYHTAVSVTTVDKNRTTDMEIYFDGPGNQGALIFHGSVYKKFIYNYNTDEIFEIDRSQSVLGTECLVKKISTAGENALIFGFPKNLSNEHIYTAAASLRLDQRQIYMGKEIHRGINCDHWHSCEYWPKQNTTMQIDWFFSDSDSWNMSTSTNFKPVPVRLYVNGTAPGDHSMRSFYHVYDFQMFENSTQVPIDPTVFETPRRVICQGRKNTKPLPNIPSSFAVSVEAIHPAMNTVSYVREYYDYNAKFVAMRYKPIFDEGYGTNPLSEVHDFNTGISYVTDLITGRCTIKALDFKGHAEDVFDVRHLDTTHLRMSNAMEFLGLGDNFAINWTYTGVRKVRDIDCDVWTAVKQDWPPGSQGPGMLSVWEWYFSTSAWGMDGGVSSDPKFNTPIRLEVQQKDLDIDLIFNFASFQSTRPRFTNYDIADCNKINSRRFKMSFPGDWNTIVESKVDFISTLRFNMLRYIKTTPLRIGNVKIRKGYQKVNAFFSVLDVTPINDTLVLNRPPEVSLDTAVDLLYSTVNGNSFHMIVGDTNITLVKADPNSLVQISSKIVTSSGDVCRIRGLKNDKPIPPMHEFMSYTSEVIVTYNATTYLVYVDIYYDFPSKLYEIVYKPIIDDGYGINKRREVHDYNTGVVYITDTVTGKCSYRAVNVSDPEAYSIDKTHLRLRNPTEFFRVYDDVVANWTYVGVKNVRNILCDHWTSCSMLGSPGQRDKDKVLAVWDWYYRSKSSHLNQTLTSGPQIPVRLEITEKKIASKSTQNFVRFDDSQPRLTDYDISLCYLYGNRRHFQIAFTGDYVKLVKNKQSFIHTFRLAVIKYTKLSPLRISNIQLDPDGKDILVTLSMLDKSPLHGKNIQGYIEEVSLDDAANAFNNTVIDGGFTMTVYTGCNTINCKKQPMEIIAKPGSIKEIIREVIRIKEKQVAADGLSKGVVAGIAVAMIVVGLLIGILIAVLVTKLRSNPFSPKRFDNDDVQLKNN